MILLVHEYPPRSYRPPTDFLDLRDGSQNKFVFRLEVEIVHRILWVSYKDTLNRSLFEYCQHHSSQELTSPDLPVRPVVELFPNHIPYGSYNLPSLLETILRMRVADSKPNPKKIKVKVVKILMIRTKSNKSTVSSSQRHPIVFVLRYGGVLP
ncbi:hypothetical protein Tco_1504191 [Tanacetum coccineum]